MSELGRLLAEARTARKLSLADAEAATRVRQKYLEALEQGNFGVLPPGAIARGFLRNYARFLELDPGEALQLYTQESGDAGPVLVASGNRQARPVDYRPLEVTLMHEHRGGGSAWRWVVALVLVAALVAGAWWVLNNSDLVRTITPSNLLLAFAPQASRPAAGAATSRTPTAPARQVTSPGAAPQPSYTVTPPPDPGTPLATADVAASVAAKPGEMQGGISGQPTPSPTSDLLTLPIPTAQPSPTPVPTATPTPTPEAVMSGISLTMKITQRSWVKVTADDNVVMQELLEAGQERSWQVARQVTVLTGNAGGTTLSMNGQNLGAMGNVGQVVERTWVVEQDKVSEVAPNRPTPTPGG